MTVAGSFRDNHENQIKLMLKSILLTDCKSSSHNHVLYLGLFHKIWIDEKFNLYNKNTNTIKQLTCKHNIMKISIQTKRNKINPWFTI